MSPTTNCSRRFAPAAIFIPLKSFNCEPRDRTMSILGGDNSRAWVGAGVVAAAAGILYFLTAARDIVVGDSPELILAAATLGVAHAPGYPLFTMLGHLFSLLPFGSIPFRVNLLAVVCDALTVGIVYFTAVHLTR